ncbi:MAG: ribonuclease HI [Clostridia bacterium]|nr:ribonuclease HI [Clostridia bacterium]
MKLVTVYTDGACSGNPGPGGYGAVLMYRGKARELSGFEPNTTNNRMELTAAIKALKALREPCKVELYTDSAYLCNAFAKKWIENWQSNGWRTSGKTPVLNQDLWIELLQLLEVHEVSFFKVKGHEDNEHNNRCDYLARQAIHTALEAKVLNGNSK